MEEQSKQFLIMKRQHEETRISNLELKTENRETMAQFSFLKENEERMAVELQTYKLKSASEAKDLQQKVVERDTEIRVLKETIWAGKADRTALEKDIYKLHIRIERLEKMV